MALRLRGATSGYIELKAPASAGDNTLTLPTNNGSANQLLKTDGNGNLSWTNDNSGVSLNGSTNNTIATVTGANALQGESTLLWSGNALSTYRDNATTYGPGILGHHQRGTIASPSVSQTDDTILNIVAKAFDGTDYHDAARIDFVVGAGTPGNNDMPGSIVFKTTDDGQGSSATRVTIQQNGNLLLDSSCSLVIHDGILHNGDTNTQIRFPANDTFTVETAGNERLRVTSTGVLSLNDSTPETWATLQINNHSTHNAAQVLLRGADQAQIILRDDTGGTDQKCTTIRNDQGVLIFGQHNDAFSAFSEKARIDLNGSLRIGNTTQNQYTSADDLVIGSGSGDRGLTIYSGSSDGGVIAFSDGTTDTAYRSGQIVYDHSANSMDFRTNGNYIRLAIKDNGDFGVGLTTPTTQSGRVFHLHAGAYQQRLHMTNATTGSSATDGFEIIVEEGTNVRIRNFEAGALMFDSGGANNEAMRIDSSGRLGIGTTSPSAKVHIVDGAGSTIKLGNTTNASTANIAYNWGGSFGLKCDPDDNAGGTKHIYMQVTGTTYFNLSSSGKVTCTGVNSLTTTGGSAVYVESDGDLLRYTSSRKYKTDIETAEDKYADEILTCRPVWYRSTSTNDIKDSSKTKSDFGWFGFIAEEIAEINPRLVNYKTKESQQQSDGTLRSVELDPSAYEAESVRYTDFIPLMVNLLKRQAAKIETLETKVAALESA